MDNEAIKTFPVIKPWKQPQYVRYGDLSAAWEIEYASKESLESIFPIIESHVRSFGFELTKSQETKCSWPSLISNENLILYTATSKNYECIDLVFDNEMQGSLKIKARISV